MNFLPQLFTAITNQAIRVLQGEYQKNKKNYNDQVKEITAAVEELNQFQIEDLDQQIYNQQERTIIYKGKEAMATKRELVEKLPKQSNILDEFITLQSDIYQQLLSEIEKNVTILADLKKLLQSKMLIGNTRFFGYASEKINLKIVLELVAPSHIITIFDKNPEFLEKKITRIISLKPNTKITSFKFCRQDFVRLGKADKQYSQPLLSLSSDSHCILQAKRSNGQVNLYLIVNGRNPVLVKRDSSILKVCKGDDEFRLQQLDKIVLLYSDQNDLISYQLTHLHQQQQ